MLETAKSLCQSYQYLTKVLTSFFQQSICQYTMLILKGGFESNKSNSKPISISVSKIGTHFLFPPLYKPSIHRVDFERGGVLKTRNSCVPISNSSNWRTSSALCEKSSFFLGKEKNREQETHSRNCY